MAANPVKNSKVTSQHLYRSQEQNNQSWLCWLCWLLLKQGWTWQFPLSTYNLQKFAGCSLKQSFESLYFKFSQKESLWIVCSAPNTCPELVLLWQRLQCGSWLGWAPGPRFFTRTLYRRRAGGRTLNLTVDPDWGGNREWEQPADQPATIFLLLYNSYLVCDTATARCLDHTC